MEKRPCTPKASPHCGRCRLRAERDSRTQQCTATPAPNCRLDPDGASRSEQRSDTHAQWATAHACIAEKGRQRNKHHNKTTHKHTDQPLHSAAIRQPGKHVRTVRQRMHTHRHATAWAAAMTKGGRLLRSGCNALLKLQQVNYAAAATIHAAAAVPLTSGWAGS